MELLPDFGVLFVQGYIVGHISTQSVQQVTLAWALLCRHLAWEHDDQKEIFLFEIRLPYSLLSCGLIMRNLGPFPFTQVALE